VMKIITSMSADNYALYGKEFIETYCKYWDAPLTVYSEDNLGLRYGNVENKSIWEVEMASLLADFPRHPSWTMDVGRFAWKAFAIMDALENYDGIVAWLDADTVTHAKATLEPIIKKLGDSYIGLMQRKDYHPCTSFVLFDTRHTDNERFLHAMRREYHHGKIMTRKQRHDAYIIGKLTEELGLDVVNLAPKDAPPASNVFDEVIKWAHHRKGNLKFTETGTSSALEGRAAASLAGF